MKRVRWFLLLLPVLALFGVLRWKTRQPEYVLRQFSERERGRFQATTLVNRAEGHLQAWEFWQRTKAWPRVNMELPPMSDAPPSASSPQPLIWISWYQQRPSVNCPHDIYLIEDGRGQIISVLQATRGPMYQLETKPHRFSQNEMSQLTKLLKQLPPGVGPAPAVSNILLVSYRDNDLWQVRVYDRRHLPARMREILQMPSMHWDEASPLLK